MTVSPTARRGRPRLPRRGRPAAAPGRRPARRTAREVPAAAAGGGSRELAAASLRSPIVDWPPSM